MFSTRIAKLSSPCDLLKQMHEKQQQEKKKGRKEETGPGDCTSVASSILHVD